VSAFEDPGDGRRPSGQRPAAGRVGLGDEPRQHTSDWRANAARSLGSPDAAPKNHFKKEWPTGPLSPTQGTPKDITLLQERLVKLGYLDAMPEGEQGVYGDLTEEAVSDFQLANGLPVTGIADATTLWLMDKPTARTEAQAVEALSGRDPRVIGHSIGTAGAEPKPTLPLPPWLPETATVHTNNGSNANCRAEPSTSGALQGSFANGSTLQVVNPQPEGGEEGWLYVTDGTTEGWVSTTVLDVPPEPLNPVDTRLVELGYLPTDTEITDEMEAQAIQNFQLMNGLPATGELDQATLDEMWSSNARESVHIVQYDQATYNATKEDHTPGNYAGDNNCGPSSVAMALASVGLISIDNADPQATVEDIRGDSGTTAGNTTGTADLVRAAEANGAETYLVDDMNEVKLALMRGDPVVLYGVPNEGGVYFSGQVDPSVIGDGDGHWITVLGYNPPPDDTFIISDPLCPNGTIVVTADQLANYADFSVDSVAIHGESQPVTTTSGAQ
jgi:peptidoglycan hydrolase-like protein with peptidoglycan-binding domain